ncbi:MAG: 3'(2'),5'-bisphosphate nucleotidase CysQ [Limimaricola sp.]|uniref:3'(2'),5'-bisphosphate nucleotidase CysQ n=1 Tax=Limimaricola sp. TaxID=2211665 RepID=UPI001E05E189|nr:3'(2'),5'-bisphosphate nucleotidase CysQ [Limimaricola sp.]MBI1417020.1 3'(2'),5'-bisphosphate nucleotidase CysQ [Limimaricola sp.]
MPATDLTLLTDAAREAGVIAKRHFEDGPRAWDKPHGAGPVTEADLEVDAMLRRELTRARPNYGWLSEETEDNPARLQATNTFIVDPIDGTRAFIEGAQDWAHSLAIAEHGRVTAAVVYLPLREMMFCAEAGGGATLNGQPIVVSKLRELNSATVLAARPSLDPVHWRDGATPPVQRKFRTSLAYRLCLVAAGRFDAMLTLRPTWEWDVAAGALIVAEASGHATDRSGAPLRFNNPHPQVDGIVAAGEVHGALVARLAPQAAPAAPFA